MAIYTRYGETVKLTAAKIIPMWSERRFGEIRTHYSKPKPAKGKTIEISEMPTWHIQAYGQEDGLPLSEGKWIPLDRFVADNGIRELHDMVYTLSPAWKDKWDKWNKKAIMHLTILLAFPVLGRQTSTGQR